MFFAKHLMGVYQKIFYILAFFNKLRDRGISGVGRKRSGEKLNSRRHILYIHGLKFRMLRKTCVYKLVHIPANNG